MPRVRAQLRQIPRVAGVGALHVWRVDDGDVAAVRALLLLALQSFGAFGLVLGLGLAPAPGSGSGSGSGSSV